jgi:hypothetical protein
METDLYAEHTPDGSGSHLLDIFENRSWVVEISLQLLDIWEPSSQSLRGWRRSVAGQSHDLKIGAFQSFEDSTTLLPSSSGDQKEFRHGVIDVSMRRMDGKSKRMIAEDLDDFLYTQVSSKGKYDECAKCPKSRRTLW